MVDFSNRDEAERWFEDQPREVCIAMAVRMALRELIMFRSFIKERSSEVTNTFFLQQFQCLALVDFASRRSRMRGEAKKALATANTFGLAAAAVTAAATNLRIVRTTVAASIARTAAINKGDRDRASHAITKALFDVNLGLPNKFERLDSIDITMSASVIYDLTASEPICKAAINAVAFDVAEIGAGLSATELCRMPLWPTGVPDAVEKEWLEVRATLVDLDPNWSVWTEWYEDRLRGTDDPRSRPLIEELEVERALIPDAEWEKGAAHINALIAEIEAKYRAQVPEQKPASAQFELSADGILNLRPSPPPEARDAAQDQSLRQAWSAHEEILSALETLDPGRNAPAFGRALKAYRKAMGGIYDELNIIGLGIHGQRIEAFAKRADDILMEDATAELAALVGSHGMFIPQFDAWLAYRDGARKELPPAAVSAASTVAAAIASDPDQAGAAAAGALRESAEVVVGDKGIDLRADPSDRPSKEAGENVISVVWNALAAKLAPALKAAREGSVEGIKWAFKSAVGVTTLEGLTKLLEIAPGDFSWVGYVIKAIKALAKGVID